MLFENKESYNTIPCSVWLMPRSKARPHKGVDHRPEKLKSICTESVVYQPEYFSTGNSYYLNIYWNQETGLALKAKIKSDIRL